MKQFKLLILGLTYSKLLLFSTNVFSQPIGWASINGGVTGGSGGDTVIVTNRNQLETAINNKKAMVLLIKDTIDFKNGDRITVSNNNITIEGIGNTAMIKNGGLQITGKNVIVRNISIGDSYIDGHWDGKGNAAGDALTLCGQNIWIDHCEFFHGFDGLLDISKSDSSVGDFITISYCKFHDHNKTMLIGSKDDDPVYRGKLNVTVHHCWFDGTTKFYDKIDGRYYGLTQRMPRVRYGNVHVFNNYYEEVDGYCIGARFESKIVAENNYFRNLESPHLIDDIGKGIRNPELRALGNIYDNITGKTDTMGFAFNPSDFYIYKADKAENVPVIVMNNAGKLKRKNNNNPIAKNDIINTIWQNEIIINPLKNDTDADKDSLRLAGISNNNIQGKIIVLPNSIKYYPPKDFYKKQIIKYTIIDMNGGMDEGEIEINIIKP
jgi:pectate lyase